MTTPFLGYDELISSQSNKFVTFNTNFRRLEATVRVLSRTNGGPPGSPADGDAYIVDVASGTWSSFAVNDIVYYQLGVWKKIDITAASEGIQLWVNDENIVVVYTGAAWVEQAGNDTGISALTDNSIPYAAGGLLVEDVNFNYDPGTDTLTVPNLLVTGTTTTLDTTNLDITDAIITLGNGNATDAIDLGLIGIRASDNVAFFFDESADAFILGYTTDDGTSTTLTTTGYANLEVGSVTLESIATNGVVRTVWNSAGLVTLNTPTTGKSLTVNMTDNTVDVVGFTQGGNSYLSFNTTNSDEEIVFGNAATNPSTRFLSGGTFDAITATGNNGNIYFQVGESGGTDPGRLSLFNSGSEIVRLDANGASYFNGGNVGIGESSPTAKIHINAKINGSGVGLFVDNSTRTAGQEVFRVGSVGATPTIVALSAGGSAAGNVGIGTSTPEGTLHLESVVGPELLFSRNDTSVVDGDNLGVITFQGNDTTSSIRSDLAYITCAADGTHSAGNNPTRFTINVTPSGSATPMEEFRVSHPAAGQTSLWLYDADNATMERVTVGVSDSAGVGFKVLRIPN
jgi:hypothetical protein